MSVVRIERDDWIEGYSENAHKICFDKQRPATVDRLDYALLAVDKEDRPCGYIAVRENDSKTVYWQFGGAFPNLRGTGLSRGWFRKAIKWTEEHGYKRVLTNIENTNSKMLQFAASEEFLIVGCRVADGKILLEHQLDFGMEIGNG